MPVQNLVDYLEGGESIDEFLAGFPTVKREQVIAFIEAAKERLLASSAGMNLERLRRYLARLRQRHTEWELLASCRKREPG